MKSIIFLLIIVAITNGIFFAVSIFAEQPSAFIKRDGYSLFDPSSATPSAPFRSLGCNMYWLGLDENEPPGTIAYPTKFRILDGLQTAKGLGLKVVRAHTLGISTGNPLSFEPSLGVFNDDALDAADFAISVAAELGLRLVIPLTDNWRYYHGGYWNYCTWMGIPTSTISVCESAFYTNSTLVEAFQTYVKRRLTHVNKYTGRAAFEETAIMAWETGNELMPPPAWTQMMARFIKSIDRNHLVLSGTDYVSVEELKFPEVDIYSSHYYPPNDAELDADLLLTHFANKVYIAGEYGWTYNTSGATITPFLSLVENARSAASALFWSLFPHSDSYGFVNHGDGFTMHYYPGNFPFMKDRLQIIQHFAWKISSNGTLGRCSRSEDWFNTTGAPVLSLANSTSSSFLVWRGVAGATSYNVLASCGGQNNMAIFEKGVTDFDLPWNFNSSILSGCMVQVEPVSEICGHVVGEGSNVIQILN